MRFEQGKSGNPQGRPKGAKGQASQTVKEAIAEALASRADEIAEKLDSISSPIKWLEVYAKFAAFIIPKNEKVEVTDGIEDLTSEERTEQIMSLSQRFFEAEGYKLVKIEP
jgi:Family of unknown function (DUF5681)